MRIKLIVIIGSLLLIGWIFSYEHENNRPDSAVIETPVSETLKVEDQAKRMVKSKPAQQLDAVNAGTAEIQYTPEQQQVLDEITPYIFSPDPYVELKSLEWFIGICGFDNFFEKMQFNQESLHPAQIQLKPEIKKKCQQHRENYPNFLALIAEDKPLDLFQPQSELGRLMNIKYSEVSQAERKAKDKAILQSAINTQNSGLILNIAMSHSWGSLDLKEPFMVLNTQDRNYAMRISNHALNLLACEYGNSEFCNNTSTLMVLNCAQYPEACGLGYISWYQQNTLPGMKRDVEKLVAYYQQAN